MRRLLTLLVIVLGLHAGAKPQLNVQFLSMENGLGSNYIRNIVQDPRGYIWMGSTEGLIRYDGHKAQLITPNGSSSRRLMADSRIQDLRLWNDRYLLIRLRGRQYTCFDAHTDSFVPFSGNYEEAFANKRAAQTGRQLTISLRHAEVTGRDGVTWIATYGDGLYACDTKAGATTHYLAKDSDSPIQTDYLLNICEDKAGNIWVCQENMGVACISRQPPYIENLFFSTPEQTDHTNSIHLLKEVNGTIFVGNHANGLKLADGQLHFQQTVTRYQDDIVAVCSDRQGIRWTGTRQSGIYVGERNYRHDDHEASSLSKGKVSDIVCDRQGNVWISFFDSGVDLAVPDTHGGFRFRHFFTGSHTIAHPRKFCIDRHGCLWLASNEGLYVFHPDSLMANPDNYCHLYLNPEKPKLDEVHCLLEAANRHVYAGLTGQGLVELDNSRPGRPEVIRRYTTTDGLSNQNIQQLAEDRQGNLWIGTDCGLTRYSPSHQTFISLQPSNSLLGNMFVENATCMLTDGRIAFGSRHGIVIVDTKEVALHTSPFLPRITSMDINGTPIYEQDDSTLSASLEQQQELTFAHDRNSLTFYFSAFEYGRGRDAKYSYRLTGYDKDWSPLSDIHFATYKNLPPGSYNLEVRCLSPDGQWHTATVSQRLVIRPPFWATWWAYLIYIIGAAAIAFMALHHFKRVNDLHNRIKVEQQVTAHKMQFFTNISHEFRTPLTIIRGAMDRIQADGVPGNLKQPMSNMQKSVSRLMRMINQLLTFSRIHEGRLTLAVEPTDVVAFVRDIYSTFREMAGQKHISYQFATNQQKAQLFIDRECLDKICYNLISNALKYTPEGRSVTVHLKVEGDTLVLTVSDTGIGIAPDRQQHLFERFSQGLAGSDSIGIGLNLTYELATAHHGSISYHPHPDGGSVFTVTLPGSKGAYSADECKSAERIQQEAAAPAAPPPVTYKAMDALPMNDLHVLVVEDDSDVREYTRMELQRYFIIQTASNGQEALDLIRSQRPDLVISDVMMPVMDGYELTRQIRSDAELSDLPVILLTALTDEAKQVKGLKSGADAYISKPFSMSVLVARCTQLLEQRHLLRANYAKEVVNKREVPAIIVEEQEQKLRAQLDIWLAHHLSDSNLNIDTFAQKMGYGRTTFYKKVKKITGLTPNDYVRSLRMERAIELLKDDTFTVSQVSYAVGIDNPYYFSRSFKFFFGISPSQYRKGEKPATRSTQ